MWCAMHVWMQLSGRRKMRLSVCNWTLTDGWIHVHRSVSFVDVNTRITLLKTDFCKKIWKLVEEKRCLQNYCYQLISRGASLKHKCLPILLCASKVCNLDKTLLQSLDFTVNRFFMKSFRTSNIVEIVHYCQTVLSRELPSILLFKKVWEIRYEICVTSSWLVKFYFSYFVILSCYRYGK